MNSVSKGLLAAALALTTMSGVKAGDVYVCETVLFCNDNGNCVEIEICDVVEGFLDSRNPAFGGSFDLNRGALKMSGLPRSANGQTVTIKRGTKLQPPRSGKPIEALAGRSVMAGKYQIKGNSLNLKIGR